MKKKKCKKGGIKKMGIYERLVFEEKYTNEDIGTTTFYFVGDKSLLLEWTGNKYPEGDGLTVSIECPSNAIEAGRADIMMSPYRDNDGSVENYDWCTILLPYEETEKLLDMAYPEE